MVQGGGPVRYGPGPPFNSSEVLPQVVFSGSLINEKKTAVVLIEVCLEFYAGIRECGHDQVRPRPHVRPQGMRTIRSTRRFGSRGQAHQAPAGRLPLQNRKLMTEDGVLSRQGGAKDQK